MKTIRIERPLRADKIANCPNCLSFESVQGHNADWCCWKCGYDEVIDDDREDQREALITEIQRIMDTPGCHPDTKRLLLAAIEQERNR